MNRSLPILLALLALTLHPAVAQTPDSTLAGPVLAQPATATGGSVLPLSLEEAIEIALERNYSVRTAALDVANANAQVREAWGQVLPSADVSSSYTRNIVEANPFAGSDAGGLFGALGSIDWLAFNEDARTDDDPATEPISLAEFRRLQQQGFEDAGIVLDSGDNPFGVANQFQNSLSITQTLYNGSAFAAIKGAKSLKDINQAALTQQQQAAIDQTRQLYYGALLARQQAEVVRASVARTETTLNETSRRVAQGVLPKFERLTAEVEVANQQTQLIEAQNAAAVAENNLLFALGLPVNQRVALVGELDLPGDVFLETVSFDDAVATAFERRPDLEQARLAIDLQQVQRDITRAQYYPNLSAFANLNYVGSVPDDRTSAIQGANPDDPFAVTSDSRGFFDTAYWNPSVAVGVRMSWNLFNGFQTSYRVQQNTIEIQKAEVQLERAVQGAVLEVEQALRNLASARQRIAAQEQTVQTAQVAYDFAAERLRTGVATQIDVRLASAQFDQAQLGYLRAVYDYLVARSSLQRAIGLVLPEPIGAEDGTTLTSAQ
ncbi:MAG: TolC family protein [Rhodothermales bacterium]